MRNKEAPSKEELIELLEQGSKVWNEWRAKNAGVDINFSDADLSTVHFRTVHLSWADLSEADIKGANLTEGTLK
jgi:uncharacterized protein YjbI with pentapeptide repeats